MKGDINIMLNMLNMITYLNACMYIIEEGSFSVVDMMVVWILEYIDRYIIC